MRGLRPALAGLGVLAMAYAVLGLLTDPDVEPLGVLVFLVAVLIGHDAVWMPVVLVAGALITRTVPRRYRTWVRAGALAVAAVAFVGLPLVLGPGAPAGNASVLPLPYGRNLVIVLGLIVAVTALVAGVRRGRKESESTGPPGPAPADG
jgi:MFS family permease